jgi:antibiotic biosynthesis monooxygenase (ABM) superfamily enzyme
MIERHITFNVVAGRTGEFERFFADRYRPAMAASPGFVRAELLREAEDPTHYQMTFRFDDAESAAGWRTSAVHQALQPALGELASTSGIQGYVVVD